MRQYYYFPQTEKTQIKSFMQKQLIGIILANYPQLTVPFIIVGNRKIFSKHIIIIRY